MGIMDKVPVNFLHGAFFDLMNNRDGRKMKGTRVIAGILLVGILAVTLAGCKNTDENKKERAGC